MIRTYLPAWCEHRSLNQPDGRFVVACYYTRDGHPVPKARAERVEMTEYAPDGAVLRVQEGIVENGKQEHDHEVVFSAASHHFSH